MGVQALGVMLPVNVTSTCEAHSAGVAVRHRQSDIKRRENVFMVCCWNRVEETSVRTAMGARHCVAPGFALQVLDGQGGGAIDGHFFGQGQT